MYSFLSNLMQVNCKTNQNTIIFNGERELNIAYHLIVACEL